MILDMIANTCVLTVFLFSDSWGWAAAAAAAIESHIWVRHEYSSIFISPADNQALAVCFKSLDNSKLSEK